MHLCESLDRVQLFLSTTPSRAAWASGVTGGHPASSPQAGMKEHQSALRFTSQIFDRNLNFWLSDTKSPDHGFSSDLSLLGLGIFCHVGLFPLNLTLELLSKDTSANWYPLDIVSAFLLHPGSSEL